MSLQLGTAPRCRQSSSALPHQATPIATTASQHLPDSYFVCLAEVVAPELIGFLLIKRHADGKLLSGVIVETEAYCQSETVRSGHVVVVAHQGSFLMRPLLRQGEQGLLEPVRPGEAAIPSDLEVFDRSGLFGVVVHAAHHLGKPRLRMI